jgi:hypothetical protein
MLQERNELLTNEFWETRFAPPQPAPRAVSALTKRLQVFVLSRFLGKTAGAAKPRNRIVRRARRRALFPKTL